MKKTAVIIALIFLGFSSCTLNRRVISTDDVYAVPSEERQKAKVLAEEQAKQEALAWKEAEAQQAASGSGNVKVSTASEDLKKNDPDYKEPVYNADDYYDYQYASRINRFYYPMGLGYYDNYYTNMYTYTRDPFNYGVSIYSNYWYGMPSTQFGWSLGFGNQWGNGYGGGCSPMYGYYDPWFSNNWYGNCGYGSPYNYGYGGWGWNNPYNNWSYMNGYNNGFYNGYYNGLNNSGWGYYNSFDLNSGYGKVVNAPRGSNGGDNSRSRNSNDLMRNNSSQKYIEEVAEQQKSRPRFSNNDRVMRRGDNTATPQRSQPVFINGSENNSDNRRIENPRPGRQQGNDRVMQKRSSEPAPSRREQPTINQGGQGSPSPGRNRGSDGGSSPRNSGGNPRQR